MLTASWAYVASLFGEVDISHLASELEQIKGAILKNAVSLSLAHMLIMAIL